MNSHPLPRRYLRGIGANVVLGFGPAQRLSQTKYVERVQFEVLGRLILLAGRWDGMLALTRRFYEPVKAVGGGRGNRSQH